MVDDPEDSYEYEEELSFVDVVNNGYMPLLKGAAAGMAIVPAARAIGGVGPGLFGGMLGVAGAVAPAAVLGAAGYGLWKLLMSDDDSEDDEDVGYISEREHKRLQEEYKKKMIDEEKRQLIEAVRKEQEKSFKGRLLLRQISESKAKQFAQRAQYEARTSREDDYQDLLRGQIASWESLLRDFFLKDAETLIDSILAGSRQDERDILEKHFKSGHKHPIFIVELWTRALRRQIVEKNDPVCEWVTSNFASEVRRNVHENYSVLNTFGRKKKNLPAFVMKFRELRNPLMHGDVEMVTAAEYQEWCDFAYGTSSLLQWLDVGFNPKVYQSSNFGWLSFIVAARAQSDSGARQN